MNLTHLLDSYQLAPEPPDDLNEGKRAAWIKRSVKYAQEFYGHLKEEAGKAEFAAAQSMFQAGFRIRQLNSAESPYALVNAQSDIVAKLTTTDFGETQETAEQFARTILAAAGQQPTDHSLLVIGNLLSFTEAEYL
jgi:hypothetical protein